MYAGVGLQRELNQKEIHYFACLPTFGTCPPFGCWAYDRLMVLLGGGRGSLAVKDVHIYCIVLLLIFISNHTMRALLFGSHPQAAGTPFL